MQGTILGYQPETGEGMISGEDGRRYAFKGTAFKGNVLTLRAGQGVDFVVSDDGTASEIYLLQGAPKTASLAIGERPLAAGGTDANYLRGTLLGYHPDSGEGTISGNDGNRYSFRGTDFKGNVLSLRTGQGVDFEVGPDSTARSVYLVQQAAGTFTSDGEKNRVIAGILAIVLGGLGIHKFYLGYNNQGLIMLLVSIFGAILAFLPTLVIAVIALIEGIIYLCMNDDDFQRIYVVGQKKWF